MLCCWLRIVALMFKDIGIHEADSWDLLLAPGGLRRADFADHQEPSPQDMLHPGAGIGTQ